IGGMLWHWLRAQAPKEFVATYAMGVAVSDSDTFEPDVLLLRSRPPRGSHLVPAEQGLIVVEGVSRGTKRPGPFAKPADYAAAGIAHYWRVEQDPVHVYAYELGEDGTYRIVADSATELVLDRPFEIRLAIADITP